MLTVDDLKAMPDGKIFAEGFITNSPEGLYMVDRCQGRELMWIAKRGNGYYDWAIYCHWSKYTRDFVVRQGQKVLSKENIQKLVPCDDAAFNLYRK